MASPHHQYTKSLAKRFGYYANWFPGTPRELGDFGVFDDKYTFRKVGNLSDLGIDIQVQKDDSPDNISHQSEKGVEVDIGLGGEGNAGAAGQVEAKIGFKFSKAGAFVFKADGVRFNSIKNIFEVSSKIEAIKGNPWKLHWRLVTEIGAATGLTVLISSSSSGEVELSGKADSPANLDIAKAELGIKIGRQKDMATAIAGEGPLQPLFRISGFRKKGLFGGGDDGFVPFGIPTAEEVEGDPDSYVFETMSPLEPFADDPGDEG